MKFSAFARFNSGFAFSSKPTHGQAIYEAMRDSMGGTYETDFSGKQQARLYAQAMCIGAAQYQFDRAHNNGKASTSTELLPSHERDYQIVPSYGSTLNERRQVASARALVTRGPRREAVEDALRTLLGDDFVSYETTDAGDAITFPSSPGDVGTFTRPGSQKKLLRLDANISLIGVPNTVPFTSLGGTDAPIVGESYTVAPDSRNPNIEKITLTAVTPATITAVFNKPHTVGTLATRPHPLWISSKRYSRIVVTFVAATDPETRRKINEQMKRQLRGISRWCIVQEGEALGDDPLFGIGDATVGA